MKPFKIALATLFFSIILLSCSRYYTSVAFVDYAKYDVFITESNSVNFNYESIGSVKSVYTGYKKPKRVRITAPSLPDVLDRAIEELVEKTEDEGGNGIINFKYEGVYKDGVLNGWSVSGMAIKR